MQPKTYYTLCLVQEPLMTASSRSRALEGAVGDDSTISYVLRSSQTFVNAGVEGCPYGNAPIVCKSFEPLPPFAKMLSRAPESVQTLEKYVKMAKRES